MFSEIFFSSKNCSSVISCWVNKETLSVKQPYCIKCHKWNCSELTRTIDHTFILLILIMFFFLPLGTCFNVVQHLLCTDLEVCNPLKYICKEECQGHEKAQQHQLSQFWNEKLPHTVLISMDDFHHLGQRSVLILFLAM